MPSKEQRLVVRAAMFAALAIAGVAPAQAVAEAQLCAQLRWTALGTAGGPVPTPERSEPANLLTVAQDVILVDTGDGAVDQLAKAGVDLGRVQTVFISHHHLDHTGGLGAVIGLRWMNQHPGVLTVYGPPGTRELVDGILASLAPQARVGFGLGKAPPPPRDSVRVVELHDGSEVRLNNGLKVLAAANTHFDHAGPRSANEPQSLSFRFELAGRSITYTGDTGPSDAVARLATKTDLLVSEVIDLQPLLEEIRTRRKDAPPQMIADMARHLSTHHLVPADVGKIASAAGARGVVLTHFAAPPGPLREAAIKAGVSQTYKGPVQLAHDLERFDVACR